MIRFLRLFAAFRDLELRLQRESDKRDAAETRCASLDAEVRRLNAALIEENHKFTDTMSLHAIGKRVHSKADPIPHREPHAPVGVGRMSGRAAVAQQTALAQEQLSKIWDELPNN